MYNIQCKLNIAYFNKYTVHCKLYSVQCTLYSVHCTLNIAQWSDCQLVNQETEARAEFHGTSAPIQKAKLLPFFSDIRNIYEETGVRIAQFSPIYVLPLNTDGLALLWTGVRLCVTLFQAILQQAVFLGI